MTRQGKARSDKRQSRTTGQLFAHHISLPFSNCFQNCENLFANTGAAGTYEKFQIVISLREKFLRVIVLVRVRVRVKDSKK
jgi:hypothetical protein